MDEAFHQNGQDASSYSRRRRRCRRKKIRKIPIIKNVKKKHATGSTPDRRIYDAGPPLIFLSAFHFCCRRRRRRRCRC